LAKILAMCQNVLLETGFQSPSTVVGNNNQDARVILQVAKRAANRLAEEYPWSILTKENEFILVKNQPSYELPSDFSRFINGTMWDRADSRPVNQASPQVWAEFKSGLINTSLNKRWRIKANAGSKELFIDPTPTTTQCTFENRDGVRVKVGVAYDYLSTQWARSSADAVQTTFSADGDTFLLPDTLLELSMKWRWLSALSQTYIEEKAEFDRALSISKAQDGGASNIRTDGGATFRFPNIPETGVGLT